MLTNLNNLSRRNKIITRKNVMMASNKHEDIGKDMMKQMRRSRSRNFVYPLNEISQIREESIRSYIINQNFRKSFRGIFNGENNFCSSNLLLSSKINQYNLMVESSNFEDCSLLELVYFKQFEKEYEDALYHRSVKYKVKSLDEISIK